MTAVQISSFGGPDVLSVVSRPIPRPKSGEILVKIIAAGVNFPDIMQRKGNYPPPKGVTDIPGLELSGIVVATSSEVTSFSIGDKVCALVSGGAYAEYCVVPVCQALPVPNNYDMIMAASIPENFFTVWTNLFDGGKLKKGDTVLIHGGSGGIGTAAIQVAKAFGATVFTTARNEQKCKACESLGAIAINYNSQDFVKVVKEKTAGKGCSLVLDIVGGDYFNRNLDVLATDGRLVQVAVQKGAKVDLFFPTVMAKRLHITGSTLRPRTTVQKGEIADKVYKNLWPLFEKGDIKPIVFRSFPLSQATQAHSLMESSEHIGKIVLMISEKN